MDLAIPFYLLTPSIFFKRAEDQLTAKVLSHSTALSPELQSSEAAHYSKELIVADL